MKQKIAIAPICSEEHYFPNSQKALWHCKNVLFIKIKVGDFSWLHFAGVRLAKEIRNIVASLYDICQIVTPQLFL
jgi:hypothetical protein